MALTRELSIEKMERIIKSIQEGNSQWSFHERHWLPSVPKIWCKYKWNKIVKNATRTGRSQKTWKYQDRKFKAVYALKRENVWNKGKAIGLIQNQYLWQNCKKSAEWNGILHTEKPNRSGTNRRIQKKMRLKWMKEKQDWMKVISSDESRICIC